MSKWIRFDRGSWGLSASIVILDRVCFYAGKTDHWGIAAEINFYDRSIGFEILNLYMGVEVWRKDVDIKLERR